MMVRWTDSALAALAEIVDYVEAANPTAAFALADRILTTTSATLADHPHAGRPGRVAGTRERVIHPSYIVVYWVKDEVVEILTVRHVARQWPGRF